MAIRAAGADPKDKTFWFANYEGDRFITTLTNVSSVPNAAFRTGILTPPIRGRQSTYRCDVSTADSANNGVGLPLDPTIQKILALYPLPNGPAIDDATGQYFFPVRDRATRGYFTIKLDHHMARQEHPSAADTRSTGPTIPTRESVNFLPPKFGSDGHVPAQPEHGGGLGHQRYRPTLVNDLRVGGNRTRDPFYLRGSQSI